MKNFAFTCGDINGIGPEICIKTFNIIGNNPKKKLLFFCPGNIFESEFEKQEANFNFEIVNKLKSENLLNQNVTVINIGKAGQKYGAPTKTSGKICYKSIHEGFKSISNGNANAIITAPIAKTALKLAGIDFPGHTEMLANMSGSKNFVMMFLSQKMIAAMITIHESIKNVPKLITKSHLKNVLNVVEETLKYDLGIADPKIGVLGLNPHAGEGGQIGVEEREKIIPVINKLNTARVSGPYVPDAFFGNKLYTNFDAVVGMYHDQILIPFKLLAFDKGVNYTAGLPIIRTSPDHGTAFDIAGKNIADPTSIIEAFKWAERIIKNREKLNGR
ncbi:MAG: 4-hydroxythreonine-4-phosphate dehydrogenase PdxA [Melioribacteraceae bacterium]|nr:4-hydroxythreonine-4-phosphate dehydrogenase PdxA [Melioribacteraceae bacterium]